MNELWLFLAIKTFAETVQSTKEGCNMNEVAEKSKRRGRFRSQIGGLLEILLSGGVVMLIAILAAGLLSVNTASSQLEKISDLRSTSCSELLEYDEMGGWTTLLLAKKIIDGVKIFSNSIDTDSKGFTDITDAADAITDIRTPVFEYVIEGNTMCSELLQLILATFQFLDFGALTAGSAYANVQTYPKLYDDANELRLLMQLLDEAEASYQDALQAYTKSMDS